MLLMSLMTGLSAIWRHRLRSALIALTVAIGISAVTSTVSLTDGLQSHVKRDVVKVGRAVSALHRDIFALAKAMASGHPPEKRLALTYGDLADLARAHPVADRSGRPGATEESKEQPVLFVPMEVGYATILRQQARARKTVLIGTVPDYRTTISYGLAAGRYLDWEDIELARAMCVVDAGRARDLWGSDVDLESCLGRRLELSYLGRHYTLEIVGVLEEPFRLREKFKALDTLRHVRSAISDRMNLVSVYAPISLFVETPPEGSPDRVVIGRVGFARQAQASGMLMYFGDLRNEDIREYERGVRKWARDRKLGIFILSQWSWLASVASVTENADIAGGVIWVVILGVAIVMIMVINMVVVGERWGEVAIRRTEGATRSDILCQFIVESCVLSLTGGILGSVGGVVAASVLSEKVTEWPAEFTPGTFILAIGASLSVGIISTALPAWQAARLDPVEVLSRS